MMAVKLVETLEDFEQYTNIWLPSWVESGYELESYITPGIERYIFLDKFGGYGSIEITSYDIHTAPVNNNFPFNRFTKFQNMKVAELDKLVIKQEAQSIKKLHEVLSFLTDYIIHNDFSVYIALLNPQVYEALVWRFKLPVTKLVTQGFSPPYVPAFMTAEDLKKSAYYKRINHKLAAAH